MKQSRLDQLRNMEVDVSPSVWSRISHSLTKKKKRRFIFWIFSFGILLLAGTVILKYGPVRKSVTSVNTTPVKSNFGTQNKIADQVAPHPDSKKSAVFNNEINNAQNSDIGNSVDNKSSPKPLIVDNRKKKIRTSPENSAFVESGKVTTYDEALSFIHGVQTIQSGFTVEPEYELMTGAESAAGKKNTLSRWSIFAGAGITFSDYYSGHDSLEAYSYSGNSHNKKYINAGIRYDVNPFLRIAVGVSTLTISQQRRGLNPVPLTGAPEDPNSTYNITTPLGTITGLASVFDQTYFNSDSMLYPFLASSSPIVHETKWLDFTLREEFSYVSIPVVITYKVNRRLLTASAGMVFNTNILTDYSIWLNERQLEFDYHDKVARTTFSAGLTAGIDFHLSRKFDFIINSQYEKNLNSITDGTKFKPVIVRVGGGVGYRF